MWPRMFLSMRGCSQERKNRFYRGKSKSRGPGLFEKKLWKCIKVGYYKKNCKSKSVDKGKGFDDAPSIKTKPSVE